MRKFIFAFLALFTLAVSSPSWAEPTERRIALVIGNGNYQSGALSTPANDAGLIAQTLQAAGFDVVGARDLDEDSLRHAFRDFLEKASASGPATVAFVYFAGIGLQLEGDNFLVPVDANITRDTDVALKAIRVTDYTRSLAALRLKATIVLMDAARANPFSVPLAGGLALVEADPGMLIAFNAAPGTIAPEAQNGYGPYAKSLAEMMREGGLPLADLFDRVRLRVNEVTRGAQVPWDSSKAETSFVFFERTADAPAPVAAVEQTSALRTKSIRELDTRDAYLAALERDTLQGYEEFLSAYPDDPMARRVRAMIAARREAITWRRTYTTDTPDAYWSYLGRYPRGPHAADARRRLAQLSAALAPPSAFAVLDYDVPPPPPDEIEYVDRPVLAFYDPTFEFAPPPPPPDEYLPPPPLDFVALEPPPLPEAVFVLPVPIFVPVPLWCRPPEYVAAPPDNLIFNNIHNTVIINDTTNVVTIKNQNGELVSTGPRESSPATARAIGPALPPTVARKAALIQQGALPTPGAAPAAPGHPPTMVAPGHLPTAVAPGQPLPGGGGHSLPPLNGRPGGTPVNAPTTTTPPGTGQPPAPAQMTRTPPPAATIEAPPLGGHKPPPPPAAVLTPGPFRPTHQPGVRTPPSPRESAHTPPRAATIHPPMPPSAARTMHRPPSSPPVVHAAPPPPMIHRPPVAHASPPPIIHHPPPQSPVAARPPPPAMVNRPPPAAMTRAAPPPAAARCQVVNGHSVCH
jgi:uncharacterized caspase-like protein